MEIISPAHEGTLQILKRFRRTAAEGRLMKYCVQTPVEEGVLLFNLLTRELVLLTAEEAARLTRLPELRERWFVVPEDTNEKELADLVRFFLETRRKASGHITSYTIFPTTDCNARCFYCYEMGRSRIPMSQETAVKAAQYIQSHCGGEKVRLAWFGGEPLYNQTAIDTICAQLRRNGVEFHSTMISNGYLFDADTVKKAVEDWNLKQVQISLDGTEAVYNRAKAYIYREGSPYQVVLSNMERLLDTGVRINVRLNMDLYNAGDLLELVSELAQRFQGKKGLRVYAHHLFKENESMEQLHSEEGWRKRAEAMEHLIDRIDQYGLGFADCIGKSLKMNHCMADYDGAVTILPTGDIGLCEHFSENEFIGHIDREGFDRQVMESWKEKNKQIAQCANCFYYPNCVRLKKCPDEGDCFWLTRREYLSRTRRQMLNEYRSWQKKSAPEDTEDMELC